MGKVLIIDDDPNYSVMLSRYLAKKGHCWALASCICEGLQTVLSFEPDVVFLDVNLPDGNGLSTIRNLADAPSRPEIIILTGYGDPDGAEIAIQSGGWEYICKADSLSVIDQPLQRALEYRSQKEMNIAAPVDLGAIVGQSAAMKPCFEQIAHAARVDANILITGESGTGKELVALAIHKNSRRNKGSFVVVDCAALPESLVESMLFGHQKGAFTGAVESRVGLVEQADGGTLFLDEVGEMPLVIQKAFLRVLQDGKFRPIGSNREVQSRFRLIAATNKDLDKAVELGTFRADLLFRLRALAIHLPPLRERGKDIWEISRDAVAKICAREGVEEKTISPAFNEALARYPWPGNVRELQHALEHAVAAAAHCSTLYPVHLPTAIRSFIARAAIGTKPQAVAMRAVATDGVIPTLQQHREESTRQYLEELMNAAGGGVARACEISGLSRSRLYALFKEHGFSRSH